MTVSNTILRRAFAVDTVIAMRQIVSSGKIQYAEDYLKSLPQQPPIHYSDSLIQNGLAPHPVITKGRRYFAFPYKGSASKALDTLLQGPSMLDCGITCNLARLVTLRKWLGIERFDRLFTGKAIQYIDNPFLDLFFPFAQEAAKAQRTGKGLQHLIGGIQLARTLVDNGKRNCHSTCIRRVEQVLRKTWNWLVVAGSPNKRPVRTGQTIRFDNDPIYVSKHPQGTAQGESVICAIDPQGKQRYIGLGLPAEGVTEEEMIAHLKRKFDAVQDPTLDGLVALPQNHSAFSFLRDTRTDQARIPGFDPKGTEEVDIELIEYLKQLPLEEVTPKAVEMFRK